MPQKRKLQVFISSTYEDMQDERRAAVEAILTAGHIPAGMELFAAGDDSQMNTIRRWIDDSDVYLLILGGRYGSMEPKSRKSYIQLEYEYALKQNKPLFAVVIQEAYLEEKVRKFGTRVIEREQPGKLRDFREMVCSRMVRFWSDPREIKLAILETLSEFGSRPELRGWIPGDEAVNSGQIAEEIARLAKENAELRAQIAVMKNEDASLRYNGLRFEELRTLLDAQTADLTGLEYADILKQTARAFGARKPTLLHVYWILSRRLDQTGVPLETNAIKLLDLGLIQLKNKASGMFTNDLYGSTPDGKQFLIRLRVERQLTKAEQYIL